jgi:replicative DNA helicase
MDFYGHDNNNRFSGIPSGFAVLDMVTQGWQHSDLHLIAGVHGVGCTSIVVNALLNAARDFGKQVVLFSLQTPREKILAKLVCAAVGVEFNKLTTGQLNESERGKVEQFRREWKERLAPLIHIVDTPGLTIKELVATAMQLRYEGADLFFIDNIQRIKIDKKMRPYCANREQEVAYITREIKTLALATKAPIIAVAELSKASNDRGGDRRPQLTELRDSNVLVNEADAVLLLYRAELYNIVEDEMGYPTQGVAEIILAKSRFTSRESFLLSFVARLGRFVDFSSDWWDTPAPESNHASYSPPHSPHESKNLSITPGEPPF